jgi:hypothetical protein
MLEAQLLNGRQTLIVDAPPDVPAEVESHGPLKGYWELDDRLRKVMGNALPDYPHRVTARELHDVLSANAKALGLVDLSMS